MLISKEGNGEPWSFADSRFTEWGATFSPDGRWIAYLSDEQGTYDVYVEPFPRAGKRWQISVNGGNDPIWSRSANELFYWSFSSAGLKCMAVSYTTEPTFTPGAPQVLFEGDYADVPGRGFDVSPDGRRFLMLKGPEDTGPYTQLNVVTNWFEELKQKAPVGENEIWLKTAVSPSPQGNLRGRDASQPDQATDSILESSSSICCSAYHKSYACCMRNQSPGPLPANFPILSAISVVIGCVQARTRCNCCREIPNRRAVSLTDSPRAGSTSSRSTSPG